MTKYKVKTVKALLKKSLIIILILIVNKTYSQEETHHVDDHDHHKHEIAIANSFVYFANEKETAYGLHFHFIRNFNNSKFGYGVAYERIFDDHKHNTIAIVGSYNPIEAWHLSLASGAVFEDHHSDNLRLAFHAETTYSFNIGDFHIGPMFEFAIDPEDYHFSIGFHIGYGF